MAINSAAGIVTILVVEDEGVIALDLQRRLTKIGYHVPAIATTAEEAIQYTALHRPDLILMDVRLQGEMDGIEAAQEIRKTFDIPIIFLTAHADQATLGRARLTEPFGYVVKPFGTAEIRAQIEIARYRHQAEQKLRRSEVWFSTTLRNIGEAVVTTGVRGEVQFMNPAAEQLTGWTLVEASGKPASEIIRIVDPQAPLEVSPLLRALKKTEPGDQVVSGEYELLSRGKCLYLVECIISANLTADGFLGSLIVFRDVTAQRALDKKMLQTARMEAISVMASSLAHDFNNLLTVILGYVDIIQSDPERESAEGENIRRSAELGAGLARQLVTISRADAAPPEYIELNALIGRCIPMIQQAIGDSCFFTFEASAAELPIRVNEAQIQEALISLAINARATMSEGSSLRIATASRGQYAVLEFSDTGNGVKAATDRIFEPVFTGSGPAPGNLRMTIVHSIVTQCGGTIELRNTSEQGTTFCIVLPLMSAEPEKGLLLPEASETRRAHTPTVLLVDDNDMIRPLLRTHFRAAGFETLEAASGEAALTIMREHAGSVDLLVTDVVMSQMSGSELARRCVALSPDMCVLFISGYNADYLKDNDLLRTGRAEFISKPFRGRNLIARARALLSASVPPEKAA